MKVYVDNYEQNKLLSKLNILKQYLINNIDYIEIISDDGIYYIDETGISKLFLIKDESIKYTSVFHNLKFIIDKSISFKEIVTTIPLNHINNKIHKLEYKIDNKSKIKLIIEGYYKQSINVENQTVSLFTVNNFYFEIFDNNEIDINEIFNNYDLNVFLSLLK